MSDAEKPTALFLRCTECDHLWPAVRLPEEVSRVARKVLRARCPKCAAPAKKLVLADQESWEAVNGPYE